MQPGPYLASENNGAPLVFSRIESSHVHGLNAASLLQDKNSEFLQRRVCIRCNGSDAHTSWRVDLAISLSVGPPESWRAFAGEEGACACVPAASGGRACALRLPARTTHVLIDNYARSSQPPTLVFLIVTLAPARALARPSPARGARGAGRRPPPASHTCHMPPSSSCRIHPLSPCPCPPTSTLNRACANANNQ